MTGLIDPSDRQLRDWAYNPELYESNIQDFELLIGQIHRSELILEFASDNNCPKQQFFLRCAYLIVGDAHRSEVSESQKRELLAFVRKAEKTGNRYLIEFSREARELFDDPSKFSYELWCGGKLAYQNFKEH